MKALKLKSFFDELISHYAERGRGLLQNSASLRVNHIVNHKRGQSFDADDAVNFNKSTSGLLLSELKQTE